MEGFWVVALIGNCLLAAIAGWLLAARRLPWQNGRFRPSNLLGALLLVVCLYVGFDTGSYTEDFLEGVVRLALNVLSVFFFASAFVGRRQRLLTSKPPANPAWGKHHL